MLELKNVELIAIDGLSDRNFERLNDSVKALEYSSKDINFKSIKILSPEKPKNLPKKIQWCETKTFDYKYYSIFCLRDLMDYIESDYFILVQSDGFILNPNKWTDKFLDYDFIGSPECPNRKLPNYYEWVIEKFPKNFECGWNGGFTIRSYRLMECIKKLNLNLDDMVMDENEDHIISYTIRNELEELGCKFPPFDISCQFGYPANAMKFDYDKYKENHKNPFIENWGLHNPDNSFGFHHHKYIDDYFKEIEDNILKSTIY